MSVPTRGTEIFFQRATTDGFEFIKLGCPRGITGGGGAKSKIDDTCLDSVQMESSPGMADPGALSVELNFDPAKVSHRELLESFATDDLTTFVIGFSGSTSPPTVDTAGTITFPTSRTYLEFRGYVADFPFDFALNANVKSTVSIQRSGAFTPHFATT